MPRTPNRKSEEPGPTPVYPMRINKYLALTGKATRREADTLIEKGLVFLNDKRVSLGQKVEEGDTVEIRGQGAKHYIYLAFNKPKDIITLATEPGEKDSISFLPSDMKRLRLFPLGRLDKASSGLLLLTNDGRLTDRLLNPIYDHAKTYDVTTKSPLRPSFATHMSAGVDIEGYITKPTHVEVVGEDRFKIVLTEGKKHQIRRMVVAMHNEVKDLRRTSIMNISLGKLKPGEYRRLRDKELTTLLSSLGL